MSGISKSNDVVKSHKKCLAEPSNYTMYPPSVSSNYFASSGLISAYSPAPLFNPTVNKGNYATSTMRPQKYKYSDISVSSANAIHSQKSCSVSQINVGSKNYAHIPPKRNNCHGYNEEDERAAAMAIASMSLSRSISRINNFKNPPLHKNLNANEDKTFTPKMAALRDKSFGHTDSGHGDSSAASNLSTMSASSDLTHVTALSSFCGETDAGGSQHMSFRGDEENMGAGEEISIQLEGATSSTLGLQTLQTFGTVRMPASSLASLSQMRAPYPANYDCTPVDQLQHPAEQPSRQAHVQQSINGLIIRA